MSRDGPSSRDPARAKATILHAAEQLFSEKGFAATSIRDVAEASGVSKALIHHHFGNKKELYSAVKRAALERYLQLQGEHFASGTDSQKFVVEAIRSLGEFYRRSPALSRMRAWSQLEDIEGGWPGEEHLWPTIIDNTVKAQENGVLRADIDPILLIAMVNSLTAGWWQFKALQGDLLGQVRTEEDLDDLYLESMLRVFLQGAAGPAFPQQQAEPAPSHEGAQT